MFVFYYISHALPQSLSFPLSHTRPTHCLLLLTTLLVLSIAVSFPAPPSTLPVSVQLCVCLHGSHALTVHLKKCMSETENNHKPPRALYDASTTSTYSFNGLQKPWRITNRLQAAGRGKKSPQNPKNAAVKVMCLLVQRNVQLLLGVEACLVSTGEHFSVQHGGL